MTDKQNFEKDINVPSKEVITKLHGNRKDLTGMKVGKLTCLKPIKTSKNKNSEWLCECECGNLKIAQTYRLLSGRLQSCGDCYHTTNYYIPMIKELEKQLKNKEQECEELKAKIEYVFSDASPNFNYFCDICVAKNSCNQNCCFEQIKELIYEVE